MKRFKPFMKNKCEYAPCKSTVVKCENCAFYDPHFYKIKVPKWLGNILYNIEYFLVNLEFPEVW